MGELVWHLLFNKEKKLVDRVPFTIKKCGHYINSQTYRASGLDWNNQNYKNFNRVLKRFVKMEIHLMGLAGVTVGRIGIRTGIDGASGRGWDALVTPSGAQEQNGRNNGNHQDQSCHSNSNSEISGWNTKLIVLVLNGIKYFKNDDIVIELNSHYLIKGFAIEQPRVPVICRVSYVKATKDFNGGVLCEKWVIDSVLGFGVG